MSQVGFDGGGDEGKGVAAHVDGRFRSPSTSSRRSDCRQHLRPNDSFRQIRHDAATARQRCSSVRPLRGARNVHNHWRCSYNSRHVPRTSRWLLCIPRTANAPPSAPGSMAGPTASRGSRPSAACSDDSRPSASRSRPSIAVRTGPAARRRAIPHTSFLRSRNTRADAVGTR